jgi:hypothetical protein
MDKLQRLRMLSPSGLTGKMVVKCIRGIAWVGLGFVSVLLSFIMAAANPGRVMHRGCLSMVSEVLRRDKGIVIHTRFIRE